MTYAINEPYLRTADLGHEYRSLTDITNTNLICMHVLSVALINCDYLYLLCSLHVSGMDLTIIVVLC